MGQPGRLLAPRALAFEKRFSAAGVFDPGVVDVSHRGWSTCHLSCSELLDSGDQKTFDEFMNSGLSGSSEQATWNFRARPYGTFDPFEVYAAIREYNLTGVAHQITTPVMICDPDHEEFWPGQSGAARRHGEWSGESGQVHHRRGRRRAL